MRSSVSDLPETCNALVSTNAGVTEFGSVPMPAELGDGGLGRVLAAGVCGSDLALFRGGPVAERIWPFVLGHETVVQVERSSALLAERWQVNPGQRAFVEEFIPCGWCPVCRAGNYRVCPRTDFRSDHYLRYGRTSLNTGPGLWGGFAEFLYLHPNARLHPVPDDVPSHVAVLATPLANGLRWVRRVAETQPDDDVVILGPGAHGLGCVVAARGAGARTITLVGRSTDQKRLAAGAALGADNLLHSDRDDVVAEVFRVTAGRGANVVVDVTGSPSAASVAPRLAGSQARVVFAGGSPGPSDRFPVDLVTNREVRILGVRGHDGADLARAMRLIQRETHRLEVITTDPVPMADGPALLRHLSDPEGDDHPAHHVLIPHPTAPTARPSAGQTDQGELHR